MAIEPLWLQNLDYPARIDRIAYDSIWTEGIIRATDLAVTESGSPGMDVQIAAGTAVIQGDDQVEQGKYLVRSDSTTTGVTIGTAPGSGQRNDLVVLKVRDSNAGVGSDDDAIFQVIAGTPSGSPVDPAVPDSAIVLARVRVPAATGSITNSLIDDLRVEANGTFNTVPDNSVTSAKIVNGAIVNADINASAAIGLAKLATGALPSGIVVSPANFANSIIPSEAVFTIPGTLTTGSKAVRYYFESARTVANVVASVSVAPTGANVIFDVNKNGTTIFTTQGNRPTITTSTFTDLSSVPDTTSFTSGDYITVDVDQIGSTIPGSDAVIKIVFG